MTDKLACPQCGQQIESPNRPADGSVECGSCGVLVSASGTGGGAETSEQTKTTRGCGCWGWGVAVFLILFLTYSAILRVPQGRGPCDSQRCSNNLKEIAVALQCYSVQHGRFPPPYTVDEHGRRLHSWRVLILPYLGRRDLYDVIRLDEPWDSPHNRQHAYARPHVFQCPSNPTPWRDDHRTDYVMISGPGTIGEGTEGTRPKDISDGAEYTILVAEFANSDVHWMEPRDYDFGTMPHKFVDPDSGRIGLGSRHYDIINVATADGAVIRLKADIDTKTFETLMTRSGGEEFSLRDVRD